MLDKIAIYVGTIIQPESNKYFSFILNNESNIQIDSIVAIEVDLNVGGKSNIVLSKVRKIETSYYIKNPDLYFLNKAANNQLNNINQSNTQYGIMAICDIIGFFDFSDNIGFSASRERCGLYTPIPLQKVYLVPEKYLSSIYGISHNDKISICLGNIIHPFQSKADIQSNVFKTHTLISGISGAGKTRLASLIVKSLANRGSHVVIIDPHFEYLDLIVDKKNQPQLLVNIYSRYKKSYKTDRLNSQCKQLKDFNNIQKKKLEFSSRLLTASTLCKILPNLSPQQHELIHSEFELAYKKYIEKKSEQNLLLYFYDYLNEQLLFREEEINQIEYIEKGKKVIFTYKINDYIELKRKDTQYNVIESIVKRLSDLIQEEMFTNEIPSWLDKSNATIDIINEDFSDDEFGKRMVNTIISHFLEIRSDDKQRILVIDEAHKLLNIEDNHTKKLIFQLLRESRKFNTALLLLTQNYDDLPPDILSLFHNVFRFKEVNNEDLRNLSSKMCHVNIVNIMKVGEVPSYF